MISRQLAGTRGWPKLASSTCCPGSISPLTPPPGPSWAHPVYVPLSSVARLPYLVHVDSGGTTCSGVFIDPITVITAASCVATRGRKGVWRQALLTVTQGLGANSSIQHPASWYVVHPGWNKSAELFNVALVRLDRCSTVSRFPRYACLGVGHLEKGQQGVACGG